MRKLNILSLLVIVFISSSFQKDSYENFNLYYSFAALGSGMGSMQPTFRVKGKNYTYTFEQNSYYGTKEKKPQKICDGTLRITSIDSILRIVKDIPDTLVYETNVGL